jgi:hypothetical protein
MPADPSSSDHSETPEQPVEDVPMSRAERRAAARGERHGARTDVPIWNSGKVHGARGAQQGRRQFTNRKTGG